MWSIEKRWSTMRRDWVVTAYASQGHATSYIRVDLQDYQNIEEVLEKVIQEATNRQHEWNCISAGIVELCGRVTATSKKAEAMATDFSEIAYDIKIRTIRTI